MNDARAIDLAAVTEAAVAAGYDLTRMELFARAQASDTGVQIVGTTQSFALAAESAPAPSEPTRIHAEVSSYQGAEPKLKILAE